MLVGGIFSECVGEPAYAAGRQDGAKNAEIGGIFVKF